MCCGSGSLGSRYIRCIVVAWLIVSGLWLCMRGTAIALTPLPDARAWEMVSPLDKNGADILGIVGGGAVLRASPSGEGITYVSFGSFAEPQAAPIGSQYVAGRRAGVGWMTRNVSLPTNNQTIGVGGLGLPYDAFSADLSLGVVFGGSRSNFEHNGPVENRPLAGAPQGYEDYYLNNITSGVLKPLLDYVPSLLPGEFNLQYLDSTPDLSHVIVEGSAGLGGHLIEEGGPTRSNNLYEWERATGQFQLINVLPSGAPEVERFVSLGNVPGSALDRAVSKDGSRVIWTGSGGSALYLRENIGTSIARTLQVDAPRGEGVFLTASSDGSKVFFGDHERLTADSTAGPGGHGDLYRFEPDATEGDRLVDLTVDHLDTGGAEVQGVLGASEDGSYLYFVANGVLAPGASSGNCIRGAASSPGRSCNLYLWHEGEGIKFIVSLSGNDESEGSKNFSALGVAFDWSSRIGLRTARVSRDGTRTVFMSERSLTGYDNTVDTGSNCGTAAGESLPAQCEEVFLYEARGTEGSLRCVSCNLSLKPAGPSGIPGGTNFSLRTAQYQSRVLSEDEPFDRVLFESVDGLVPSDTNGVADVYEYEDGHVYLLSDGQNSGGASFVDASVNGDDVFFITRASLVDQDTDRLVDLYDARSPHVPGETVGFTASPSSAPCVGEECREPGLPSPVNSSLSSVGFVGSGNLPPSTARPII